MKQYTTLITYTPTPTYLCPVMLSQKTTPPAPPCEVVMTQAWARPLDLVPMQTYASRPNPSNKLHNKHA